MADYRDSYMAKAMQGSSGMDYARFSGATKYSGNAYNSQNNYSLKLNQSPRGDYKTL